MEEDAVSRFQRESTRLVTAAGLMTSLEKIARARIILAKPGARGSIYAQKGSEDVEIEVDTDTIMATLATEEAFYIGELRALGINFGEWA